MDLVKLAQKAQEELNVEKAELEAEKAQLAAEKKDFKKTRAEYVELVDLLKIQSEDLFKREEAVKKVEDLVELQKKASSDINAVATARAELRTKENELFQIQEAQKAKDEELTKREYAVSDREETYKEKLRKEFLEEISNKLGR